MPSDTYLQQESLTIVGPAGALEALVESPLEANGEEAAVVCHPHPLYGGTMTNKVVYTLARACNQLGMPTVRFNFRGVGGSSGTHADGVGETEDVLAVMEWTRHRWPGCKVLLAGFS